MTGIFRDYDPGDEMMFGEDAHDYLNRVLGKNIKHVDLKNEDEYTFNEFNNDDEEMTGDNTTPTSDTVTDEKLNDVMLKKPLAVTVSASNEFIDEPNAELAVSPSEYIDEPMEEEEQEITDTQSENKEVIRDLVDASVDAENLPIPMIEGTKAIQKSASQIVANVEPEKNLALLKNTLSYLPMPLFPAVADSVANTLMDAKDENGLPIFESKKEIIKLLKDLRNSKLRNTSKSGRSVGKKAGNRKRKHERDYLDYMLTKRINPAVLITPRMK